MFLYGTLSNLPKFQLKGFNKELLIQGYVILSKEAKILRSAKIIMTQGQLLWCRGCMKSIFISWACQKWLDYKPWGNFGAVLKSYEAIMNWKSPRISLIYNLGYSHCSRPEKKALPGIGSVSSSRNHRQRSPVLLVACWRIDFVFNRISGNRNLKLYICIYILSYIYSNYYSKLPVSWPKFPFYA